MATKDTVVQELVVNTLTHKQFKAAQEAGTLSPYELYGTPDTSVRLPVLTPMWFDHLANDVSWLRADTFSWHSGDVYKAAYEHLAGDCPTLYAWYSEAVGVTFYTDVETPSVGDDVYNENGEQMTHAYQITGVSDGKIFINSQIYAVRSASSDVVNCEQASDTIGDIEITYYQAEDGHKICLPDQESKIMDLYEQTGVAWYYMLDTGNKQFKLPRSKHNKYADTVSVVGTGKSIGFTPVNKAFSGNNALYPNPAAIGGTNTVFQVNTAASLGLSTDPSQSQVFAQQAQDTDQYKYLYFYVGNFEQDSVEQTAGLNAELFNNKADVGFGNVSNGAKELMASASMPSDTYKDLTLGASGNTYTAPADGWYVIAKTTSGSNPTYVNASTNTGIRFSNVSNNGGIIMYSLPVKKGDVLTITYNATGATNCFRFIYAEGAKHLA
jgi:hypothetical protein